MTTLLASGARDTLVCVWHMTEKRCVQTLSGHKNAVSGVAFAHGQSPLDSSSRGEEERADEWTLIE